MAWPFAVLEGVVPVFGVAGGSRAPAALHSCITYACAQAPHSGQQGNTPYRLFLFCLWDLGDECTDGFARAAPTIDSKASKRVSELHLIKRFLCAVSMLILDASVMRPFSFHQVNCWYKLISERVYFISLCSPN